MVVPTFSGAARTYLGAFPDFRPKTLGEAKLLSKEGKKLLGTIPALNLEAEMQAMKSGMTLEQQKGINETQLAIQELQNEQAKKKAIIDQLSGTTMAGTALTKFLSGGETFNVSSALGGLGNSVVQKTNSDIPTVDVQSYIDLVRTKTGASEEDARAMILKGFQSKI